jgi:hypothetical protein
MRRESLDAPENLPRQVPSQVAFGQLQELAAFQQSETARSGPSTAA